MKYETSKGGGAVEQGTRKILYNIRGCNGVFDLAVVVLHCLQRL